MNVNIIIAQKPDHSDMMPPPGAPTPMPRPPMPMPGPGAMPAPPPGGAPAGPMPSGPNMPPPSMARAAGGRTGMKYGAGSGMGRLEKIGKE
jgi:U1 small nuclear ribonucleoprotein C